jgi:hypothetical protein
MQGSGTTRASETCSNRSQPRATPLKKTIVPILSTLKLRSYKIEWLQQLVCNCRSHIGQTDCVTICATLSVEINVLLLQVLPELSVGDVSRCHYHLYTIKCSATGSMDGLTRCMSSAGTIYANNTINDVEKHVCDGLCRQRPHALRYYHAQKSDQNASSQGCTLKCPCYRYSPDPWLNQVFADIARC